MQFFLINTYFPVCILDLTLTIKFLANAKKIYWIRLSFECLKIQCSQRVKYEVFFAGNRLWWSLSVRLGIRAWSDEPIKFWSKTNIKKLAHKGLTIKFYASDSYKSDQFYNNKSHKLDFSTTKNDYYFLFLEGKPITFNFCLRRVNCKQNRYFD